MKPFKTRFLTSFYSLEDDENNLNDYIYNIILPELEKRNIYLTNNGTTRNTKKYYKDKQKRRLFDIGRIMKVLKEIDQIVTPSRTYTSSYVLKNNIEHLQKYSISIGNCIMVFLIAGEEAEWHQHHETFQCLFQVHPSLDA